MKSFRKTLSLLVFLLVPSVTIGEEFPADPVSGTQNPFIFNEFMQFEIGSLRDLHTGIDINAPEGDEVYAPVHFGNTCRVVAVGSDNVFLLGRQLQEGAYVACQLLHLNVSPTLQAGQQITAVYPVGTTNSLNHLHAEIFLSPDVTITDLDLRNPRRHAFSQASWRTDVESPVIDSYEIMEAGIAADQVWKVRAHDTNECAHPSGQTYNNGLFALYLSIDGNRVDPVEFDHYKNKAGNALPTASEYYACTDTDCNPTGPNDPNVLVYKLKWTVTPGKHVWSIVVADEAGNQKLIDPDHPPVAPMGQIGGTIENGRVRLTWKVESVKSLKLFNVWQSRFPDRDYLPVSEEPIYVQDGRTEYEFFASLPKNWESVWYRVMAEGIDGGDYILAEREFDLPPLITSIRTHPNPSASLFDIDLSLARSDALEANIFDVRGKKVRSIEPRREFLAGRIHWSWDARDDSGRKVPAGVYILGVDTEKSSQKVAHKIIVAR